MNYSEDFTESETRCSYKLCSYKKKCTSKLATLSVLFNVFSFEIMTSLLIRNFQFLF